MRKGILRVTVSVLMVLSLVTAACGPTAVQEKKAVPPVEEKKPAPVVEEKKQEAPMVKEAVKPSGEVPKYGGILTRMRTTDVTSWSPILPNAVGATASHPPPNQELWHGDWARGPAGGYGTNETDWAYGNNDLPDLKAGQIAEKASWTVDATKGEGTIIYQIRRGMHYGLNPALEASRLVSGRELTADDVLSVLKRRATDPQSQVYLGNPELRVAQITKTGPWEVTVKLPVEALMSGIIRFTDSTWFYPPEAFEKYGGMVNWKASVGTGPLILTEYVPGSQIVYVRNPNYWEKDPVGPGKGNQLPYIDGLRDLILPDKSTQLAALRTGKIETISSLSREDATSLKKTNPQLLEHMSTSFQGRGNPPLNMRIDTPPFNDIRVRRAMNMAIDFNAILQGYFGGLGQIHTWPYSKIKEYEGLYLDFADYPESAKELFSYNPGKAKQLLKEAGYPNGFKTSIVLTSTDVDFISIYKDYLSKIGVDLVLDVKESAVKSAIQANKTHTQMITGDTAPVSTFFQGQSISGTAHNNRSMVDDPHINETLVKVRLAALTDMREAMKIYREMTKYVVDQAYVIPAVIGSFHTLWWPWLKNYSGELNVGYDDPDWPYYIWIDQELKKSMGYGD